MLAYVVNVRHLYNIFFCGFVAACRTYETVVPKSVEILLLRESDPCQRGRNGRQNTGEHLIYYWYKLVVWYGQRIEY